MHWPLLTAIAAFALVRPVLCQSVQPTESYPLRESLLPREDYELFWKHDQGSITMEFHVRTKGWVAIGFSPDGNMVNSDMFTGWIVNGQPHAQDRWASRRSQPSIDKGQDWIALGWGETDTHTYFKLWRPLMVKDPEDHNITSGLMNIVWAYGQSDPPDNDIDYHRGNKGSRKGLQVLYPLEKPKPVPTTLDLFNAVQSLFADNARITQENKELMDLNEDLTSQNRDLATRIAALNRTVACIDEKVDTSCMKLIWP